ncbi:phosphatase PAP2 family protein [Pseudomonas sp. N040]|uniref:phosphatase PAP2 family protein n=1 Tax=Pseudomonas sp. N040 TaxID=2785325 RepID=UPI0018A3182C|nr:phosphatase PAP2 family protein [Pseudomonas sp. N040]MBF7730164.1 phosphatase PAP2 family protein [Pseudomonas sp. N040]MBW7013806.1 phosphatase PAP2 family protein [Pseudomonas sp. N040]
MSELLHDLSWVLPLRSDLLTPLMYGFTLLGYEKFILLFLPLGYWAWNKPVFLRLFVLVAFTALLNAYLKDLWQNPRPDLALRLDGEVGDSFGAPSGHSQVAVVLWLWLAYEMRRGWLWLLCGLIAVGVMFSRMYLGVHDLEDVLAGAALGGATLLVFALVRDWQFWSRDNAPWHLALIVAVTLLAQLAWPGTAPTYVPLLAGLLLGVVAGYWQEERWLGFRTPAVLWRRALVALIGCVAFLLFQALLKRIDLALGLEPVVWQGLRGLLMGLFVAALMPWGLLRARLLPAAQA